MKRTPLQVLELAGDPLEVAYQLGRRRRAQIARCVEFWNRTVREKFRGRGAELRVLERAFLVCARKGAPDLVEELVALAEGAHLGFADIFRLNLTELATYVDKCTTLIFPLRTPHGRRILLAHNEDWDPRRNDVFILKAKLPGLSYVIVAYDGYLPGLSSGRNSFGLCHAINYLRPADRKVGLPRIFITRRLVTARNFSECLQWVRRSPRAFGQGIHLAQGSHYLGIELTARRLACWRPRLPAVHTNHYLTRGLAGRHPRLGPSSFARLGKARQQLRNIMTQKKGHFFSPVEARRLARRILSDRSTLPYAIWREADRAEDRGATVAAAIFGTDQETFDVYRRLPCSFHPLSVLLSK